MRLPFPLLTILVAAPLAACGPAPRPPSATPGPPDPSGEPTEPPAGAGMPFYDAQGAELRCMPPRQDCPPVAPDNPFTDACRLAGYRVQRCGCEALCSGKVERKFYDETGQVKPCQPVDDCAAPSASAAFQDACTERGYHLEECSCEQWLCSGDPTE